MSTAHSQLYTATYRQLKIQIGLMLVTAALFGLIEGGEAAIAALFGGGITAINTLLLRWHLRRADKLGAGTATQNLRLLYRAALERFMATGVLFALGIGLLHLTPFALLIGFLVGLLGLPATGFHNVGLKKNG